MDAIDAERRSAQVARMSATSAVLPVALIVLIGYFARRSAIVPASAWPGVEIFCYRVLFPAVMMISVYRADLTWARVGPFGMALMATTGLGACLVFALKFALRLPNPRFTTMFQTVTRWNAFVGMALATGLLGSKGIGLISVGMAFLIPIINVVNVSIMAIWGSGRAHPLIIIKSILGNPLIQGCMAGLVLNLGAIALPAPAAEAINMIGSAAIAVSLLIVGAGIQIDRLLSLSPELILAVTSRLLLMPVIFWMIASYLGLSHDLMIAGILVTAAPTAANGYIVARQMGGDADLYADILTWQTVLAVITIPFVLSLLA